MTVVTQLKTEYIEIFLGFHGRADYGVKTFFQQLGRFRIQKFGIVQKILTVLNVTLIVPCSVEL
jgi:hypothetical protein